MTVPSMHTSFPVDNNAYLQLNQHCHTITQFAFAYCFHRVTEASTASILDTAWGNAMFAVVLLLFSLHVYRFIMSDDDQAL